MTLIIFLLFFFQELLFSQSVFRIEVINLKKGFFAWPVDGARLQRVRNIKECNISSRLIYMPIGIRNFVGLK